MQTPSILMYLEEMSDGRQMFKDISQGKRIYYISNLDHYNECGQDGNLINSGCKAIPRDDPAVTDAYLEPVWIIS
jgi:hypothetical protein